LHRVFGSSRRFMVKASWDVQHLTCFHLLLAQKRREVLIWRHGLLTLDRKWFEHVIQSPVFNSFHLNGYYIEVVIVWQDRLRAVRGDRKSTRLNSSHLG